MNILIDSNIILLKESLESQFNVVTYNGGELTNELINKTEAEILFVRSTSKCDSRLLAGTKVKLLGTATAGIDNLDINYLDKSNIQWFNAPGSNSISVAEFVTLAILHWCKDNNINLQQQTLGIVGYGNVGKKVAHIFENYCQQILVYDPFLSDINTQKIKQCNYQNLLESSSIITFHVPLTKGGAFPTQNMLDYDELKNIDNSTLTINMARGGVVNQSALIRLKYNPNNLIFDVWENEPNIDISFAQDCFLSTPHIAGHSYEGKLRGTLNMLEAIERYMNIELDKRIIMNKINKHLKSELSTLDINSLYELLDNNIQIRKIDKFFKNGLRNFETTDFNKMRRSYKMHNETITENSFK